MYITTLGMEKVGKKQKKLLDMSSLNIFFFFF